MRKKKEVAVIGVAYNSDGNLELGNQERVF